MTFEPLAQFDVVVVPFPFVDSPRSKRRPALVLSRPDSLGNTIGHSVMAMITSTKHSAWPMDAEIGDLESTGLPAPSKVRMKLFTIDHELVLRKAGSLGADDRDNVRRALEGLFGPV